MQFPIVQKVAEYIEWFFNAIGLGDAGVLVALALFVGIPVLHRQNVKQLEKDKEKGAKGLVEEHARVGQRWLHPSSYRDMLRRALRQVDDLLGQNPWGPNTFDFCLRIAVVYPIAIIFLVWVATGINTSGISGFFPVVGLGQRVIFLICIGVSVFAFVKSLFSNGFKSFVWNIFMCAFAYAGACSVTFPGAVASAFVGAFALAGDLVVVFVFACPFALAITISYLHRLLFQAGHPSTGFGVLIVLLMSVVLLILWLQPTSHLAAYGLLVFLATLPLVNVVFDWASIGLTRWLLRRTVQGHSAWINAAIDIVSALLMLVLLAVTTVAAIQTLNLLAQSCGAAASLIDVAGLLSMLRDKPGDPSVWWTHAVLFSTLLPSLTHGCLAAGTFITARILPCSWLEAHQAGLMKAYEEGTLKGNRRLLLYHARMITLRQLASIGVVVGCLALIVAIPSGLGIFIWQYFGGLLLWVCEETAAVLGAPVQPVLPDPADILRGGGLHV